MELLDPPRNSFPNFGVTQNNGMLNRTKVLDPIKSDSFHIKERSLNNLQARFGFPSESKVDFTVIGSNSIQLRKNVLRGPQRLLEPEWKFQQSKNSVFVKLPRRYNNGKENDGPRLEVVSKEFKLSLRNNHKTQKEGTVGRFKRGDNQASSSKPLSIPFLPPLSNKPKTPKLLIDINACYKKLSDSLVRGYESPDGTTVEPVDRPISSNKFDLSVNTEAPPGGSPGFPIIAKPETSSYHARKQYGNNLERNLWQQKRIGKTPRKFQEESQWTKKHVNLATTDLDEFLKSFYSSGNDSSDNENDGTRESANKEYHLRVNIHRDIITDDECSDPEMSVWSQMPLLSYASMDVLYSECEISDSSDESDIETFMENNDICERKVKYKTRKRIHRHQRRYMKTGETRPTSHKIDVKVLNDTELRALRLNLNKYVNHSNIQEHSMNSYRQLLADALSRAKWITKTHKKTKHKKKKKTRLRSIPQFLVPSGYGKRRHDPKKGEMLKAKFKEENPELFNFSTGGQNKLSQKQAIIESEILEDEDFTADNPVSKFLFKMKQDYPEVMTNVTTRLMPLLWGSNMFHMLHLDQGNDDETENIDTELLEKMPGVDKENTAPAPMLKKSVTNVCKIPDDLGMEVMDPDKINQMMTKHGIEKPVTVEYPTGEIVNIGDSKTPDDEKVSVTMDFPEPLPEEEPIREHVYLLNNEIYARPHPFAERRNSNPLPVRNDCLKFRAMVDYEEWCDTSDKKGKPKNKLKIKGLSDSEEEEADMTNYAPKSIGLSTAFVKDVFVVPDVSRRATSARRFGPNDEEVDLRVLTEGIDIPAKDIKLQIAARRRRRQKRRKSELLLLEQLRALQPKIEVIAEGEDKEVEEDINEDASSTTASILPWYCRSRRSTLSNSDPNRPNLKNCLTLKELRAQIPMLSELFLDMRHCRYLRWSRRDQDILEQLLELEEDFDLLQL